MRSTTGPSHPIALYGSVGMGDIVPMAELGHALLGDLTLAAKEAVSLVDNDAFATAIAALAIHDYGRLLDAFDAAGALDLEGFAANLSILHPAVGREHPYVPVYRRRSSAFVTSSRAAISGTTGPPEISRIR